MLLVSAFELTRTARCTEQQVERKEVDEVDYNRLHHRENQFCEQEKDYLAHQNHEDDSYENRNYHKGYVNKVNGAGGFAIGIDILIHNATS